MKTRTRFYAAVAFAALIQFFFLIVPALANAADSASDKMQSPWSASATLYVWGAGLNGDVG